MQSITEYLRKLVELPVERNKFISKDQCFKRTLDQYFGQELPGKEFSCKLYEQVAFGQGNEKEKIDTVYSSSLQSFLIFSGVNENNPITIDGIKYTHVQFEYKNKVIGYPSSVDVVLWNNQKQALFVESKLYEIVRDSNEKGTPVIGPTYFSDNQNGYKEKLKFDKADLENIGIYYPQEPDLRQIGIDNPENYVFGGDKSKIKDMLRHLREKGNGDWGIRINKNEYLAVRPVKGNTYVYSYGIKQILSHMIGMLNFASTGKNCSNGLTNILKDAELSFISLYNALPGYKEKDAEEKIKNYKVHMNAVEELLNEKRKDNEKIPKISHKSYQELKLENKEYFEDKETIVRFYHLEGKQE